MNDPIGMAGMVKIQRCMSFTEKIVVGKISVKVMHSGKAMYIAFTENAFKFMYFATFAVLKHAKGTRSGI